MWERSLPRNTTAMAFVTVFGLATPSSAQPAPKNADPPIAFAAPPSAQSANAQIVDVKKKKKSAPKPRPGSLGCGNGCSAGDIRQRGGPSSAESVDAPVQHHQ